MTRTPRDPRVPPLDPKQGEPYIEHQSVSVNPFVVVRSAVWIWKKLFGPKDEESAASPETRNTAMESDTPRVRIAPIVRDMEALLAKIRDGSVVLEPEEALLLTRVMDLVRTRERTRPSATTRPRRSR